MRQKPRRQMTGIRLRPGPVKLLANGELKVALTIKVDAASEAAKKAVEAAGGKLETPNRKG